MRLLPFYTKSIFALYVGSALVCSALSTALFAQGNTCISTDTAGYNRHVCNALFVFCWLLPLSSFLIVWELRHSKDQLLRIYRNVFMLLLAVVTLMTAIVLVAVRDVNAVAWEVFGSWAATTVVVLGLAWYVYYRCCKRKRAAETLSSHTMA